MPSLVTRLDDLLGSRVPVEPTLVVPLAHELAHIEVDSAMGKQVDPQLTVFEYSQHGEFPGLVIAGSAEKKRSGSPVLNPRYLKFCRHICYRTNGRFHSAVEPSIQADPEPNKSPIRHRLH
jgi:hypothetical protein